MSDFSEVLEMAREVVDAAETCHCRQCQRLALPERISWLAKMHASGTLVPAEEVDVVARTILGIKEAVDE